MACALHLPSMLIANAYRICSMLHQTDVGLCEALLALVATLLEHLRSVASECGFGVWLPSAGSCVLYLRHKVSSYPTQATSVRHYLNSTSENEKTLEKAL